VVLGTILGRGVVLRALGAVANAIYAPVNERTTEGTVPPVSSSVSGSKASFVGWNTLGRMGRDFVATATTAEELELFHGAGARLADPVRVYVGVDSAASATERAELAVRELERAGGFDRKVLAVWVPTGTSATYGFAGLTGTELPSASVVVPYEPYEADPLKPIHVVQGVLQSVSQVFLKASSVAALLLLAGLAVSSLAAAAFAFVGAILAVATAHLFGAESAMVTGGLLGFSPVLTAIALGTVFYRPSWRVAAYTAVATVFTVIAQSALNAALSPFAIPALTAPFILVTWLFTLPGQYLGETSPAGSEDERSPT
jgi:hypothetical protein